MLNDAPPARQEPAQPYAEACAAGRRAAAELIERMRDEENPTLLRRAVIEMVDENRPTGHLIGFYHAIAVELIDA